MHRLTWLALALLLGGCERNPGEAHILAEAGKLAQPLPGLYRSTTTFESFELANAPASEAQVARDRMARLSPQVREFCLTPENARGGFRKMLADMQGGACTIEKFATTDGKLDARMRCKAQSGIESTIGMKGEADPQRSRIALEIQQEGDGIAGGTQRMRMTVESVRTGECPAPPAEGTADG